MQQTKLLTRSYRIFRVFIHVIVGISIVATTWPFVSIQTRTTLTKWWCKKLLTCFNIQLRTTGELPTANLSNSMFLANHISWVDIYALNSITPLQFIAKSDINNWPILGYLERKSDTIFIDRNSRKDTAHIVKTTASRLISGSNVGFFPEGTTTDGTTLVRFKSSIVQAAIDANAMLCPVAIRYPLPNGETNTAMAYADKTTMAESIKNILKQKTPVVELHFLPPINPTLGNRQVLTQMAFSGIAKQLNA